MLSSLSPELCPYTPFSPSESRGKRILVVDDCADGAESMALLLRFAGYEVETAYNGAAALRAARFNRPDVVLLDISMPGMSGYEVACQLRGLFHQEIALIALTAFSADDDRRHCCEAGFDCHFVKPVDFETVEKTLQQLAPVS